LLELISISLFVTILFDQSPCNFEIELGIGTTMGVFMVADAEKLYPFESFGYTLSVGIHVVQSSKA
jgi:hypothetical protein